ncbi:hypothetical protein PHMEG_0002729 [Phytophthora megakarya]|uniref:Ubiquitin-like protease family profile domain-containing protein n=1 Tax=Phytophthora megakarya TaxID=4795 RepID=A0A225WZZ6_9STRA|nr:hypothetical protein PHMEG_0002729 [Phytophthora megakarya]
MEQKVRVIKAYGAADPGIKNIISVINLGHHWDAFLVDIHAKRCYVFDPMQLNSHYKVLKAEVRSVVEPMLQLTDTKQSLDVLRKMPLHADCGA